MRPVKLVMQAFGSYLQKTEIPFEALGTKGLFLITGDTGAGKTTIFDAITYALYNQTSGTDRETYSLRSDYADEKRETYVELTFSHQGREYQVFRSPQQELEKRSGTGTTSKPANAKLLREPEPPIEGAKAVDKAILDLLKIDYQQFKQICMIAQGEFREVLNANAKTREEILQKLFATEKYQNMAQLMGERARKSHAEVKELLQSMKQEFDHVSYAEDSPYADAIKAEQEKDDGTARYQTEEKRNLLASVIEEETTRIARQETLVTKLQQESAKKTERYTLIHSTNELFRQYDQAVTEQQKLEEKREEMTKRQAVLEKQKRAVYEVKPVFDRWRTEQKREDETEQACLRAAQTVEESKKAYQAAGQALAEAESRRDLAEKKKQEAVLLSEEEGEYQRLEELNRRLQICQAERNKAAVKKQQQEERVAQLKEVLLQEEAKRQTLSDCPKRCAAEQLCRQFEEQYQTVALLQTKKLPAFRQQKRELATAQEEYQKKRLAYETIARECLEYERRLEEARAGILASGLEEGKPCPVCGSTSHPNPAMLPEDEVTEEAWKAMRKKQEKAEQEKNRANEAAAAKSAAYEAEETHIREEWISFLHKTEQETETIESAGLTFAEIEKQVADSFQTLASKVETAKKEFAHLSEEKQSLDKLLAQMTEHTKERETQQEQLEVQRKQEAELAADYAALSGERAGIKTLRFASLTEAKNARKQLEEEATTLFQAIEAQQKKQKEAGERLSGSQAAWENWRKQAEEAKGRSVAAKEAYQKVKAEQGFSDDLEGETSEGEKIEAFFVPKEEIERQETLLQTYHAEVAAKEAKRNTMEQALAGKERADEESAKREAEESKRAERAAQEQLAKCTHRKEQNEAIQKRFEEICRKSEKKIAETTRLDHLAALLSGRTVGKNKTSFETYVQLSGFDGIIQAANRRLYPMSGGQYQLFRHENQEEKKNVALNLDILDQYTGKKRPVSTLSGGESFMASLSLALGLSDHVTAQAGGIQIETLFIDEGFGTLDEAALSDAIEMLRELSEGEKLIGIISHREELKQVLGKKVLVKKAGRQHGNDNIDSTDNIDNTDSTGSAQSQHGEERKRGSYIKLDLGE